MLVSTVLQICHLFEVILFTIINKFIISQKVIMFPKRLTGLIYPI